MVSIDGLLDSWKTELETAGSINIAGDDMISLPTLAQMRTELGFPLDMADFPNP